MSSFPVDGGNTLDLMAKVTVEFKGKVDTHLSAIAKVNTAAELDVKIKDLIVDIKILVALLVGAKVNLDADAKLKLAIAIHAMIVAIVKVCATVVAKLGVSACASIMASLDVALHGLILTLGVVVEGLIVIIAKLSVNADATVVAALKACGLNLLAKICVFVNVSL
ncbi:hypothetical protein RSOLAG1IB_07035 [Rhizoctonia solani AG-1 IB]|nr:hypothetical protein RSOLAG1IB_07035 [Rhizoctonia solani AG-1 IB]